MRLDGGRRRSSAGLIFALGAAAVATAPLGVTAAPAVGSIFEGYSFGRRDSDSNISIREANLPASPARQVLRRSSALASSEPSEADHAQSAQLFPKRSMARVLHARQGGCLDSSANQDDINTLLWDGGANTRVALCPGAVITVTGSIVYSNANQEIYTVGYPTDNTRAKIVIGNQNQEVAIWNNCDRCTKTAIRNIQVDGSRQTLGRYGNSGLIEMGGNAKYQVVDGCNISNPRGWTAVHVAEGYKDSCSNQFITNNEIGPCGTAPNTAKQFRVVMTQLREFMATPKRLLMKRQVAAPGQWADGISLACRNSTVTGNTITGATDGGIVLFGAPGSTITGNTIIAKGNTLLGGINLVDHGPFNGDYSGTVVSGNTIIADDAMIKIGIAVGLLAWGDYNSTDYRTKGGIITDNNFVANGNGTGYFGYGTAVGGNDGAIVDGNNYDEALFGGTTSAACQKGLTPVPQASIWDPYTVAGGSYQPGVTSLVDFNFLICTMPCQYSANCGTNMTLTKNVAAVNTTASTTSWSTSTVAGTVIRTPATTSSTISSTVLSGTSSTLASTSTGNLSSTALTSTTKSVSSTSGLTSTTAATSSVISGTTSTGISTSSTSTTIATTARSSGSTAITTSTTTKLPSSSSTSLSSSTSTSICTTPPRNIFAPPPTADPCAPTTASTSTTKAGTTSTTNATSTTGTTKTTSTTTSKAASTSTSTSKATISTKASTSASATTSTKAATSASTAATASTNVGLTLGRSTTNTVILLPVSTTKTTSSASTTSIKTTTTSSEKITTSGTSAKPATSTSVKTTSTTSAKTTSTSAKTSSKPATTAASSSTSSKVTTTTKVATTTTNSTNTSVFTSAGSKVNLFLPTGPTLAKTRGGKRSLEEGYMPARALQKARRAASEEVEEIEQQLRIYGQSMLRSRTQSDMDEVARLEHKLMIYRDWILPGAVRTPRPKRNLADNEGIDKRDTLADDGYWS